MTEETKKQLMQSVYKLASIYEIPNAELVSFKKRSVLLEVLKAKDELAFQAINNVIEAYITLDRIENDKEKQLKKLEHWTTEKEVALVKKEKEEENFKKFIEAK